MSIDKLERFFVQLDKGVQGVHYHEDVVVVLSDFSHYHFSPIQWIWIDELANQFSDMVEQDFIKGA